MQEPWRCAGFLDPISIALVGTLLLVDLPRPDIRFTTTDDGVGIAYWEIGSGTPIVIVNNWGISHAELEWSVPSLASFYVELAERYQVVRFDPRGFGLSDYPPGGMGATTSSGAHQAMTAHHMGLDIAAVAKACDLDTFALLAVVIQGPVCIEYAANHPEDVSALILCDTVAKVESSYMESAIRADAALAEAEMSLGAQLPVSLWDRLAPTDELNAFADLVQANRRRDTGPEAPRAQLEWNADPLLQKVAAPTLVLTSRHPAIDRLPDSRHLAAGIRDSQLRVVEGTGSSSLPPGSLS